MGCTSAITNTLTIPTSSSSLIKPDKLVEDISFQLFKKIKQLGIGSFGKVHLIKSKETHKQYAMKTIIIAKENDLEKAIKKVNFLEGFDHNVSFLLKQF